jgi:phosphoenolpyruvate carboxykinase (GTP)
VLRWIIDRCKGVATARETAIGHLPNAGDLDLQGLDITAGAIDELLTVDSRLWREEFAGIDRYLSQFGAHVPASLKTELKSALERVHSSQA